MVRTRWAGQALRDLDEIRRWIARDSPRQAERSVRGIRRATESLKRFPSSGRIVPEWHDDRFREVIHAPWRIVYRYEPSDDTVLIVTVIHSSRELPPLPSG